MVPRSFTHSVYEFIVYHISFVWRRMINCVHMMAELTGSENIVLENRQENACAWYARFYIRLLLLYCLLYFSRNSQEGTDSDIVPEDSKVIVNPENEALLAAAFNQVHFLIKYMWVCNYRPKSLYYLDIFIRIPMSQPIRCIAPCSLMWRK